MKAAASDAPGDVVERVALEADEPAGEPAAADEPAGENAGVAEVPGPFVEGEHETRLEYGHGRLPLYVAVAWIIFLVAYAVYFGFYGWPDLKQWGAP
jgi:hypothetical protein